jgi:hypothetical protein
MFSYLWCFSCEFCNFCRLVIANNMFILFRLLEFSCFVAVVQMCVLAYGECLWVADLRIDVLLV